MCLTICGEERKREEKSEHVCKVVFSGTQGFITYPKTNNNFNYKSQWWNKDQSYNFLVSRHLAPHHII